MTTITLRPEQTEQAGVHLVALASVSASIEEAGVRLPLFVPRSQVYYWTKDWQIAEREAVREIERGEAKRFSTGADAIAWLLGDDE